MGLPAAAIAAIAGAQLLGGGISAFGQLQAGNAAKRNAEFQAAVLRNNAAIADFQAEDAITRGRVATNKIGIATRQFIGSQRAALAAAGVVVDQGSALDLIADTAAAGQDDINTALLNAEREAFKFRVDAQNLRTDARLVQARGREAQFASRLGAAGTLLSSIGSAAKTAAP